MGWGGDVGERAREKKADVTEESTKHVNNMYTICSGKHSLTSRLHNVYIRFLASF